MVVGGGWRTVAVTWTASGADVVGRTWWVVVLGITWEVRNWAFV